MAKKKTIDLRSVEPTPVPEGNVNIVYNGTRIAGFTEETEATLKTGGTRVEHDIAVNYKPVEMSKLTVNNPDRARYTIGYASGVSIINNKAVTPYEQADFLVLTFDGENYFFDVSIPDVNTDKYNFTVNNTTVPYDSEDHSYYYEYNSPIFPETISIDITLKV